VRGFFAAGNGGQVVAGVPELDLTIAIFAGNYSDDVTYQIEEEFIPNYLLPAVREAGDDPSAPIQKGTFATQYGRDADAGR
jgi:hypothetical protein